LLVGVGCGGRSVQYGEDGEQDTAAVPTDTAKGAPRPSAFADCRSLCTQCALDQLVGSDTCVSFCAEVDLQVVDADCAAPYDDLMRCRAPSTNACSPTACPAQTNAFSVCVLGYCDVHRSAIPLCTGW